MNMEKKRIIYCDKCSDELDGYSKRWFHAMTNELKTRFEVVAFPNLSKEIMEVVDYEYRTNGLDGVISHCPYSEQFKYKQSFSILGVVRTAWSDLPIIIYTGAFPDDVHPAYSFADTIIAKSERLVVDAYSLVSALESAWREKEQERAPVEPEFRYVDGEVEFPVEVRLRTGLSAGVVISLGKYCRMQNTLVLVAREGDECWFDLGSPLESACLLVQSNERIVLRVCGSEFAAIRTARSLWRVLSSKYSNNIAIMLES